MPSHPESRDELFRALFDANLPDVWSFLRRRVTTGEDADDLASEVFAIAWRRFDDLPPKDAARLWLFGVARNVLANHHRTTTRRERLHMRLAAVGGRQVVEPAEPSGGVHEALAALEDGEREILMLRAWDGLAVGEIAELLGITPNAASIRLHRARGRLAAVLGDAKDRAGEGHVTSDVRASRKEKS